MTEPEAINPTPINPHRFEIEDDMRRVKKLATVMDKCIGIPGTRFTIGLDGLVGLIPGVGDLLGLSPLIYFVRIGRRHDIRGRTYLKFVKNHAIDFVLGLVPIVGDLLDFAHKANVKNAHLLHSELTRVRDEKHPFPDYEDI